MQPHPQGNDNRLDRSRDCQISTRNFDKEIMETFVYIGFPPFSKFLLVLNMVSLCVLKVRLVNCEEIEIECFHPENVCQ